MAFRRIAPLIVLACALGCATYAQDEGLSSPGSEQAGASNQAGTMLTAGTGASGETHIPTDGGGARGGTGNTALGGTPSGGSFASAGTFGLAGTLAAAGVGGSAAGGTPSGGSGGGGSGGGGGKAGDGGASGRGGSGGDGSVGCATHPISAKATWTASASVEAGPCPGMPNPDYCGPASRAIDGLLTPVDMTRYTTGAGRTGAEWLQIDFGTNVTLSQVVLTTAAGTDYTHGYEVRMSAQAASIAASPVVVSGTGQADVTTITFPLPTTGRFLRINQTTSGASWWSIQELDASCQ